METLYRPNAYPTAVRAKLRALPPLATEIANRWMMGWPDRVKALLKTEEYLPALIEQEQEERRILSSAETRHLAQHEILQEHGLSLEPPTTSTSPDKTSAPGD